MKLQNSPVFPSRTLIIVIYNILSFGPHPQRLDYWFRFFRCGLRGAYLELLGFSKDVKLQFRSVLSSDVCATSIGQVCRKREITKLR